MYLNYLTHSHIQKLLRFMFEERERPCLMDVELGPPPTGSPVHGSARHASHLDSMPFNPSKCSEVKDFDLCLHSLGVSITAKSV